MNRNASLGPLYRLARLYGVQTAFYGIRHHRHTAAAEGLLAVLRALGAPVASLGDVSSALREKVQAGRQQVIESVTVAWNGAPPAIAVSLPSESAGAPCTGRLETESGESYDWKWQAGELDVIESADCEGRTYLVKKLVLPQGLPYGYHKFQFQVKGKSFETLVISAPRRTFTPAAEKDGRSWGAFLPLYALKTRRDWGAGDYSGLGALADWVAREGGGVVGTLPLLPVFLDEPCDASPYAPVSRLLWNEFYCDVTQSPEFSRCREAKALAQSSSFTAEIADLRKLPLVDYRRVLSLKRGVMERLSRYITDSGGERLDEFRRFLQEHPVVAEYARFRATVEKQRKPWTAWPPRLRDGDLREGDGDEDVENYHLYAQWLAHQQVRGLAEKARRQGVKLYFDMPVGVHPDGYDVWRHRDIFAANVSAGAPPDPVFTTGQDWGFPPLHPEKVRAQGYRYIRDYLHHHLQYADMLRLDHVMGLHRLYWVPRGFQATQGVYVRYRPGELYAVLAVESHRHRSVIVGEDLGIVPGYIRPAMARHGLHRMYILYYELADSGARMPRRLPRNCIAALNTHDMPPFAAFWEGEDIRQGVRLGLLNKKEAEVEIQSRRETKSALAAFLRRHGFWGKAGGGTLAALKACLAFLSGSRAHTVLINLEDLWRETQPQNVPGTGVRFPSWRRKARYALEEFCRMKDVSDILKEVDRFRKKKAVIASHPPEL